MESLADRLYGITSRSLKVPSGPLNPNGEAVIRTFNPAPRYAGYRLCRWVFTQVGIFIPFALFLLPNEFQGFIDKIGFGWIQQMNYSSNWLEQLPDPLALPMQFLSVGGYVIQLVFSFVFTFLSAKSQSYLLTNYSLRIRRGLWVHQQITLSLKNIQQVKFSQNLLERLWGIGSLEVRTAGGGSPTKKNKKNEDQSHTGKLEGLLDPIALRELVNASIKDASLANDSAQPSKNLPRSHPTHPSPELKHAIDELLLACKSLRTDIQIRTGFVTEE